MPAVGISPAAPVSHGTGRRTPRPRPVTRGIVAAMATALAATLLAFVPATKAQAAPVLLSQGKPATASSEENAGTPASAAVDGNAGTRWSSAASDPQWIQIDLGSPAAAQPGRADLGGRVRARPTGSSSPPTAPPGPTRLQHHHRRTAAPRPSTVTGDGPLRPAVPAPPRATGYGYSLWEFKVFGTRRRRRRPADARRRRPRPERASSSTRPRPDIQAKLDEVFRQQESAQFGTGRYALLFKPGTYNGLNAQIGFYTSIAGLGLQPDDTTINGDVTVDAGWFNGNATQNFWRSAENLALNPVNGTNRWAVSQAAPFRRMHVKGGLNLAPDGYGWASGGYIADSKIDGQVGPYSQQQWYTRDSSVGGWVNGVWNMTFSGVEGAPGAAASRTRRTPRSTPPPISREKPFLYLDGNDVQGLRPGEADQRPRRRPGATARRRAARIPLNQFYVVKPGADRGDHQRRRSPRACTCSSRPASTTSTRPINVNRADTVVLGLGLATIIPDNGVTAMKVADVDGVKLAGFLIDAGPVNSADAAGGRPAGRLRRPLRQPDHRPGRVRPHRRRGPRQGHHQHGGQQRRRDHRPHLDLARRPRRGRRLGDQPGRLRRPRQRRRRAGHRACSSSTSTSTTWSGTASAAARSSSRTRRRTTHPTRPPSRTAPPRATRPTRSTTRSTTHEGWGLGSYCYYNVDPTIVQDHGFKAPVKPGVKFHGLLVVSLGGKGQYEHVINSTGASTVPAGTSTVPSMVVSFPAPVPRR